MKKLGYAEKYALPLREDNTVDIPAFWKGREQSSFLFDSSNQISGAEIWNFEMDVLKKP